MKEKLRSLVMAGAALLGAHEAKAEQSIYDVRSAVSMPTGYEEFHAGGWASVESGRFVPGYTSTSGDELSGLGHVRQATLKSPDGFHFGTWGYKPLAPNKNGWTLDEVDLTAGKTTKFKNGLNLDAGLSIWNMRWKNGGYTENYYEAHPYAAVFKSFDSPAGKTTPGIEINGAYPIGLKGAENSHLVTGGINHEFPEERNTGINFSASGYAYGDTAGDSGVGFGMGAEKSFSNNTALSLIAKTYSPTGENPSAEVVFSYNLNF